MSRTITANYTSQLLLTAAGGNPVSIAEGVTIIDGNGVAVFVAAGDWSIYNAGIILENATNNSVGFYLQKAAAGVSGIVLTNQSSGQIIGQFGVFLNGTGTIDNQGAIAGTARDAIRVAAGGTVVNEAGASAGGVDFGVLIYGGQGSVTNLGQITGNTSDGIALIVGGTVANNGLAASVQGGNTGVYIAGGLGSVANQGVITGSGRDGVIALAGGNVVNQAGALITGLYTGVDIGGAAGTVTNHGVIQNQVAFTNQTVVFGGVLLGAGGSVTNSAGGTIRGTFYGVWTGGGTAGVTNGGMISGSPTASGAGVALTDGGTVTNNSGGTIAADIYGVRVFGAAGTVVNTGSIASFATVSGAAVALSAGGSVSNNGGGTITGGVYGVRLLNVSGAISNAGSIGSSGTTTGAALSFRAGGSATNSTGGVIGAGYIGVLVSGSAGTVTNAGSIGSTQTTAGAAVLLGAGGSVTNDAGGAISSGLYGVRILTAAGTVTNAGSIASTQAGSFASSQTSVGGAVFLGLGGSVSNGAGGSITSGLFGVRVLGAAGTVSNSGYISSTKTFAGAGVDLVAGGSATNGAGGLIVAKWIGVQIGQTGSNTGGTFVNQGSVFSGDIMGDGAAVWVHGPGEVINDASGTIDGAPFGGVAPGGFGIVTYYQTTVINRGMIGGTNAVFAANSGVGNLIEVAPGAAFRGLVQGAKSAADSGLATLELLSGASAGTISGFGPTYQNFGHVALDNGARWTLGGTVAAGTSIAFTANGSGSLTLADPAEMQGTITGFVLGDTIGLSGITVTGSSYAGGVLTLTEASGTIALDVAGTFSTGDFITRAVSGGTDITLVQAQDRTLNWTGVTNTAFLTPSNWSDVTNGLDPARSAPNSTDTATFNTGGGAVSGTGTVAALAIGSGGSGALRLSGGATIVAGSLGAGVAAADVGQIGLTGAGTKLIVSGAATVAGDGTGVLSVLAGATFAAGDLTAGALSDSSGAVVVSGTGSALDVVNTLNIGTALGIGDLTVGPGAVVHAAVVNLQGQVVLEGGLLDPTVQLINQGQTAGGFGTIAAGDIIDEGVIQAGGNKASQKLLLVQGDVLGGGTLTVNGAQPGSAPAGVLQINAGGTLELTGAVLNGAETTFTDNLSPAGTYTVDGSVIDVTFADGKGVLRLDDIAGFGGTIETWHGGDSFVIPGGVLSDLGVSNGDTLTMSDGGGTDRIIFGSAVSAAGFAIVNGDTVQVACFAAGTRIETEQGKVRVEALAIGSRLITADGRDEPIVWIGQRDVDCERHPEPEAVWPVRIRPGAFGENVPVRDLYLSPDHAVFVNNVLVPVKLLINGISIAQEKRDRVRYFHVELPRHALILAEGLTVESYLDTGGRANFANAGGVLRLFPDFAARPAAATALAWETRGAAKLIMAGKQLGAIRASVDARAMCASARPPVRHPVRRSRAA